MDASVQHGAIAAVAGYYRELGLPPPEPVRPPYGEVLGQAARGLAKRFMREMHERAAPQLAFPAQNVLTGRLRAAAAKAGNPDFVATGLVAALEAETLACLGRLTALRA